MSAQIICSGLAQAALWATSMPTITAGTCAVPDKDELHSVRSSLIRRDIWCARASIAYGARRCLGY